MHNTIAAAETGVGAPFVAALPEQDALVLGYLEGEVMDAEKLRSGDHIAAIADRAADSTAAGASCRTSTCSRSSPATSSSSASEASACRTATRTSRRRIRELERAMRVRPEPTVPCNNDLLAENFIRVDGEMRLIDYEYSGNNEASFELGNVWSESNLSHEQLEELVAAYWGRRLRNKVARARLWGLMSKYGWTLWGSIQDGISDLDFDFWGWAMEKYERAVAELDGPEFEQLLADVQRDD